jgi:glycosyltransferase involved in cell wall biosynthesis
MHVLARALRGLGHAVEFETPRLRFPNYTLERLMFNRSLSAAVPCDLTVGFDMDGYRIARAPHHVASLKGVIADEVRFESGLTRLTMGVQARCERLHAERAARVLVTSRYSGERAREFYRLAQAPTVLFVGRFYRRKRVHLLLRAAAALRARIPELEIRLVGAGPCGPQLRRLSGELKLAGTVAWLGDISRAQLIEEYQRSDLFCLPSVQEGFGIVLLEAMAAGKPIVAARAAAIPEVAPHGLLVEPESAEALAEGIEELYRSPEKRADQGRTGAAWVEQFDAPRVAQLFLDAVTGC